jgi:anti-sigma factor RsiW
MAHLGSDVAAYVDGQLSETAMREASTHLDGCEPCARAVRQQRLLKSRMSTVASPEPPAGLLASLASLPAAPPPRERWWTRLGRSLPFRAGAVLAGASVAVVVTAYAVGSPEPAVGDDVSPPFNRYAAGFAGPSAVQTGNIIPASTMDELDGEGWPCQPTLAGDLHRVWGSYTDGDEVVALRYSDGRATLDLFEQNGHLDRDGLDGFEPARMGDADVWVRPGVPMLVTWDRAGTVYTIVTDADRDRVERAVTDLPSGPREGDGLRDRVDDGFSRMTAWVDAA